LRRIQTRLPAGTTESRLRGAFHSGQRAGHHAAVSGDYFNRFHARECGRRRFVYLPIQSASPPPVEKKSPVEPGDYKVQKSSSRIILLQNKIPLAVMRRCRFFFAAMFAARSSCHSICQSLRDAQVVRGRRKIEDSPKSESP